LGTLVLPVALLLGFGPGLGRAIGRVPVTIAVGIHPDRIAVPDTLPAGAVILAVSNRDRVAHGFAVRRVDAEQPVGKLDAPLRPGATARIAVRLEAGRYRLYCPNAVEKGLLRVVVVRPQKDEPESGR
jgi:hypothetical protein